MYKFNELLNKIRDNTVGQKSNDQATSLYVEFGTELLRISNHCEADFSNPNYKRAESRREADYHIVFETSDLQEYVVELFKDEFDDNENWVSRKKIGEEIYGDFKVAREKVEHDSDIIIKNSVRLFDEEIADEFIKFINNEDIDGLRIYACKLDCVSQVYATDDDDE